MPIELSSWKKSKFISSALRTRVSLFVLLVFLIFASSVSANWSPLIDRLIADGFEESAMRELFSRPEVRFEAGPMSCKLEELLGKPARPMPAQPVYNPRRVYKPLLKEKILTRARSYLRDNAQLLENISLHYCVPKEIIVSILLIETRLGDYTGSKYAFNNLASMALSTDLELLRPYLRKKLISKKNEDYARTICHVKSEWAYNELKALIDYTRMSAYDPFTLTGSIYGAIGLCQFMPTNIFLYGVDADDDGRINLFAKPDALHSIANYLREHGWKCSMDRPSQVRVIFDYNKSSVYVNTVLAVAEKLKGPPPKETKTRIASKKKQVKRKS